MPLSLPPQQRQMDLAFTIKPRPVTAKVIAQDKNAVLLEGLYYGGQRLRARRCVLNYGTPNKETDWQTNTPVYDPPVYWAAVIGECFYWHGNSALDFSKDGATRDYKGESLPKTAQDAANHGLNSTALVLAKTPPFSLVGKVVWFNGLAALDSKVTLLSSGGSSALPPLPNTELGMVAVGQQGGITPQPALPYPVPTEWV